MKKFMFCLTFISLASGSTFASNVSDLNSLINTPGFSIKQDGSFVTDWKKNPDSRSDSKIIGKELYGEAKLQAYAEYRNQSNLKIPTLIALTNIDKSQRLFAELDASGSVIGTKKCANYKCATVTKDYCGRIYKDMAVTDGKNLIEKVSNCQSLQNMDPTKEEIKGLAKIWKDDQNNSEANLDRSLRNLSEKYAATAETLDTFHNRIFKIHSVELPGARLTMIAELCNAIFPNGSGVTAEASSLTTGQAAKK